MSELVERYENLVATGFKYAADEKRDAPTSTFEIYVGHFSDIGKEIAAEITRLRAENAAIREHLEKAREALQPFAVRAGVLDGLWKDHETHWSPEYGSTKITIGDLRAARDVYRALKDKEERG